MKYNYLARTQKGEVQSGSVDATSELSAIRMLQAHNLIVISIKLSEQTILATRIRFLERVKKKEVVIFCRQLSTLVGSDVPLVNSIRSLGGQTENIYFKEVLLKIASDVDSGMSFSKALVGYRKVFSNFFINLVRSGEVNGRLQESLEYLAKHLENEYYLTSKVKGAMIYPAFILSAFIIIGVLMMVMVVPSLIGILEESGQELPMTTKVIIWLSGFLRNSGWILGLVLLIIGVGWWRFVRTVFGKRIWDRLELKIPIFGKIFQQTYLARFSENLSTLIKSGLPIIQALSVAGRVVGNTVFQDVILEAKEKVKGGESVSSVLKKSEHFPPMVVQMIMTGEKTGKLDSILENLSDFYSKEVDNIVSNLTQLIEPILIIGLGVMVGILVAAILLPIYNIAGGF